jgi:hypothetical protein
MKQIASAYTYNKITGVITLTGVNIGRDQLLLIVNSTRNVTYYNFADSATSLQAFTPGANTSLTLNSSVITASAAHTNLDALTIYYDDQASTVTVAGFNTAENFGSGVIQPIADAEKDTIRSSLWIPVSSAPNGSAGEGQILSQAHPMPVIWPNYDVRVTQGGDPVDDDNPFPIDGTVTAKVYGKESFENTFVPIQIGASGENFGNGNRIGVSLINDSGTEYGTTGTPLKISGTMTGITSGITTTGINPPVTSFTASTKTITIANFPNAPVIGNFLLITNTTRGVIVHNSVDPQKICTFGSPNYNGQFYSITATFPASLDTTGMQNSDTFHVVYAPEAVGYPIASQVELVGRTQTGSRGSALLSTGITGALLVDAGVTGAVGTASESAASTDTSTSGINGLLKRLLQRITTLIYPPFASGSFTNSGGASTGIDCGGYDYLVQHISGGGGGYNRPIAWSYDNVNWTQGGVVFKHNSNAGGSSTGNEAHWMVMGDILGTSSGIFVIPVVGRYFRVNASGTGGGGSWTHNWYLHKGPFPGIVEEGIGARSSAAASTDTSDVGLNGLFKRLLQRLTTLLPANLTVSSTRLLVDGSGVTQPVSIASVPSHPVTGPLTNTELRATAVPVSGTVTANTGLTPLTDTQLRATAVPVSLASVPSHAVTGPLTDTQLRATAVTSSVNNAGWKLIGSRNWNSDQNTSLVLDITGYSELAFFNNASSGTSTTLEVLSANSQDKYWLFGNSNTLAFGSGASVYFTPVQGFGSLYVSLNNWDDSETQTTFVYGRTSTSIITNKAIPATTTNSTNFTSTTPSSTISSNWTHRLGLTIFNEGPGTLLVSAGSFCTTSLYQVRLLAGDYWECPASQAVLQHSGVFLTTGTARITEVY